jgi:hypothetical protein
MILIRLTLPSITDAHSAPGGVLYRDRVGVIHQHPPSCCRRRQPRSGLTICTNGLMNSRNACEPTSRNAGACACAGNPTP